MRLLFFSCQKYERAVFEPLLISGHVIWQEAHLDRHTVKLADGFDAVCVFVNDQLDRPVLEQLARGGVKLIALRCAGFNNVDLAAAEDLGLTVVRVPAYSPEAVAEHTLALILTLNRKVHKAWNRIRDGNFHLTGLLGFNLHGKTVGLVGLGRIGLALAKILKGFGMQVYAFDPGLRSEDVQTCGIKPCSLEELYRDSDIISLHCPLNEHTHHMINARSLAAMKPGVMLINTSRGALVDTVAVIDALKSCHLGYLGMDVYEQEGDLFFRDLSEEVIQDDIFQRLLTFPNVVITGHQGFFTYEALEAIAHTTCDNMREFEQTGQCGNSVDSTHLK